MTRGKSMNRPALQRGDETLHNLMGGCGTYIIGGVAVDLAAVQRGGAAIDADAATGYLQEDEVEVGKGGSVLQRGDGSLRDLMGGWVWHSLQLRRCRGSRSRRALRRRWLRKRRRQIRRCC